MLKNIKRQEILNNKFKLKKIETKSYFQNAF